MADVLIVHDDSVVSRVAWLLEQRVAKIKLCEGILNGGGKTPEDLSASAACVKAQLDAERWALQELLEDIEEGLLKRELEDIWKEYARETSFDDELPSNDGIIF